MEVVELSRGYKLVKIMLGYSSLYFIIQQQMFHADGKLYIYTEDSNPHLLFESLTFPRLIIPSRPPFSSLVNHYIIRQYRSFKGHYTFVYVFVYVFPFEECSMNSTNPINTQHPLTLFKLLIWAPCQFSPIHPLPCIHYFPTYTTYLGNTGLKAAYFAYDTF